MRWELITRFEVLKKGKYSRAIKSYAGTEDFFKEHLPGKPLVPQVWEIHQQIKAALDAGKAK